MYQTNNYYLHYYMNEIFKHKVIEHKYLFMLDDWYFWIETLGFPLSLREGV